MTWNERFTYIPQYEYAGTNQHGDRYKKTASKQVKVAVLTAKYDDDTDLRTLVLMSHTLGVPVHYEYESDPQTAYIEVVAKEDLCPSIAQP